MRSHHQLSLARLPFARASAPSCRSDRSTGLRVSGALALTVKACESQWVHCGSSTGRPARPLATARPTRSRDPWANRRRVRRCAACFDSHTVHVCTHAAAQCAGLVVNYEFSDAGGRSLLMSHLARPSRARVKSDPRIHSTVGEVCKHVRAWPGPVALRSHDCSWHVSLQGREYSKFLRF